MILRVLKIMTGLLVATALLVLILLLIIYLPWRHTAAGDVRFDDVEFVTIILAAATVVLTGLAIVLAIAGAVGYVAIREASTSAARDEARAKAEEVAARTVDEVVARTVVEAVERELGRVMQAGMEGTSDAGSRS